MLFNEPKLLKSGVIFALVNSNVGFSALQRAEIAEIDRPASGVVNRQRVSVLFNEPKLLKCQDAPALGVRDPSFSALQRAEIAEISAGWISAATRSTCFSALQRAEIAEI